MYTCVAIHVYIVYTCTFYMLYIAYRFQKERVFIILYFILLWFLDNLKCIQMTFYLSFS